MQPGNGDTATVLRLIQGIPLPRFLPAVTVLIAGASAGFFAWSYTASRRTFHSYLFFNNLTMPDRSRLILLLGAGVLLFLGVWILLAALRYRKHISLAAILDRSAAYFSPGILLGFWPFLTVQAFEVFYTFQLFFLVMGFLAVTFLIAYSFSRQDRASRQLRLPRCLPMGEAAERLSVYLLAPIYALHQDATNLLVLQTILLAVGAIPLYLIARRRLGNPWTALIIAVVYLLYPALVPGAGSGPPPGPKLHPVPVAKRGLRRGADRGGLHSSQEGIRYPEQRIHRRKHPLHNLHRFHRRSEGGD